MWEPCHRFSCAHEVQTLRWTWHQTFPFRVTNLWSFRTCASRSCKYRGEASRARICSSSKSATWGVARHSTESWVEDNNDWLYGKENVSSISGIWLSSVEQFLWSSVEWAQRKVEKRTKCWCTVQGVRHGAKQEMEWKNVLGTQYSTWTTRERVTSCVMCWQSVYVCTCNVRRCSVHTSPSITWELEVAASEEQLTTWTRQKEFVGIISCSEAKSFPLLISTFKKITVQSRLKIANNPNFVSTSIHCPAATARMKTNLLKENISIQFDGETFWRATRVQIVVGNFAFCCAEWIDLLPCPVLWTCSLYSRR